MISCSRLVFITYFIGTPCNFFQFGNAYLSVLKIFLVRFSLHFMCGHKLPIAFMRMLTSAAGCICSAFWGIYLPTPPSGTFILLMIFWRALVILSILMVIFSSFLSVIFSTSLRILTIDFFSKVFFFLTPRIIPVFSKNMELNKKR